MLVFEEEEEKCHILQKGEIKDLTPLIVDSKRTTVGSQYPGVSSTNSALIPIWELTRNVVEIL